MIEKKELLSLLVSNVNYEISNEIKTYLASDKNREEMLEKYGKKCFLDPKRKKFVVVNPFTGREDCTMIYIAYIRASFYSREGSEIKNPNYYKQIRELARGLFSKQKCEKIMNIQLTEEAIKELNMIDFFDLSLLEYSIRGLEERRKISELDYIV